MSDLKNENWERDAIMKLATSALDEQRKTRRWNMLFKFLLLAYLIAVLWISFSKSGLNKSASSSGEHTALIELAGVIAPDSEASADRVVTALRRAFEDEGTKGVILRVNSPGGSPVQSGYIFDEIKRLRGLYPETPLYAVIADICASGGYYVAAAADEIYADKASMVGSIGVLMNGFGFVDAIDKLGVERRLLTAGDHKGFLDPFSPVRPEEAEHVEGMLGEIHQQFIDTVRAGRGDRLKGNDELFSGLVWTGEKSVELGLVDALGSSSYVAREVIGAEEIVDFTAQDPLFDRLAKRFGAAFGTAFSHKILGQSSGPSLQ